MPHRRTTTRRRRTPSLPVQALRARRFGGRRTARELLRAEAGLAPVPRAAVGGSKPSPSRRRARRPTAAETRAHARRSEERIGTARVKAVKAKRQAAARQRRRRK